MKIFFGKERNLFKRRPREESSKKNVKSLNVLEISYTMKCLSPVRIMKRRERRQIKTTNEGELNLKRTTDGRVFIDRDPDTFKLLISYLRNNFEYPPPIENET